MKKRILYPAILGIQLILMFLIARIFDLETENTLYAGISLTIFGGTIVALLLKIIHDYKKKDPPIQILYLPVAIIVFVLTLIWILVLTGVLELQPHRQPATSPTYSYNDSDENP